MRIRIAAALLLLLPAVDASGQSADRPAARPAQPGPQTKRAPATQPDTTAPAPTHGSPMTVEIVRSADPNCGTTCPEWIAAQGRIDPTTPVRFRKVLSKLGSRKLPILIDSPGGSVDESLAIGRMIRAKGLAIAVTKTELVTCAPADTACRKLEAGGIRLGHARPMLSKCASSCAFLLAGGARRHVGTGAFVGVHQITSFQTRVKVLRTYRLETRREWGVPVETVKTLVSEKRLSQSTRQTETKETDYIKIAKYFTEMGVGPDVMRVLRATPATQVYWLSRTELQATALATDSTDGTQLLLPQPNAAEGPAPAAKPQ
jgi:hypothetical protein